jgi:ribA/ribD-fused uncharacterized protein
MKPTNPITGDGPITVFRNHFFFLSNFFPVVVPYEGLLYPSVEHAYQAAKFPREPNVQRLLQENIPAGEAKAIGRSAKLPPRGWSVIRLDIMRELVQSKFKRADLRELLLATGNRRIAHVNDWGDKFWGMDQFGNGEDHLGRILVATRTQSQKDFGPGR